MDEKFVLEAYLVSLIQQSLSDSLRFANCGRLDMALGAARTCVQHCLGLLLFLRGVDVYSWDGDAVESPINLSKLSDLFQREYVSRGLFPEESIGGIVRLFIRNCPSGGFRVGQSEDALRDGVLPFAWSFAETTLYLFSEAELLRKADVSMQKNTSGIVSRIVYGVPPGTGIPS